MFQGVKASVEELQLETVDSLLTDWVDEPIGTASIGQVYKAISSGREAKKHGRRGCGLRGRRWLLRCRCPMPRGCSVGLRGFTCCRHRGADITCLKMPRAEDA